MSSNIFRIFNPNAEKEDPAEKRKGQLRRAQRSYRDRKDRYIKSLEVEVQRAAHRETKLIRELESLRGNVEELSELLSQYGIPTPSQSPGGTGGGVGRAAARPGVEATAPGVHPGQLQKQKGPPAVVPPPDAGGRGTPVAMDSYMTHAYPEDHRARVPTNQPPLLGSSRKASDVHGDSPLMQNADLVAIAMEFVLTLERPCLGHLHGDPTKPHDPTGHVLTTSAQLHFASSSGPVLTPPETAAAPSYEHTPADVLDRLLDLAPDVCSEGQVTPVQAWCYVRARPYFGGLDALSLRRLAERLQGVVKCHGFGAVVEAERLEIVVYETLIVGQLF